MRPRPKGISVLLLLSHALVTGLIVVSAAGSNLGCQQLTKPGEQRYTAADSGGRVVAEGRPPLTFMYPGKGGVVVRDLDSREIVFSLEPPMIPGPKNAALFVIDEEKRALVVRETREGKTVDSVMVGIDPNHRYRIVYVP